MTRTLWFVGVSVIVGVVGFGRGVQAHCDTLTGPVVSAARLALQTHDVTPVLKWVKESEEREVREAFQKAAAVRVLNPAARDLADRFFFETVVRLHRLGEGEPYTGLKDEPDVDVAVQGADRALEDRDVEPLVKLVTDHAAAGVRERFARVKELERHAGESVAAGRQYVDAYVDFIHFVEDLHIGVTGMRHVSESREPDHR